MIPTLRYACRQLAKSPGFSVVAVVMLALGIGMSTSTFSVTNGVLLSAMPFSQPEQLFRIHSTSAQSQELAPGTFLDVRAAATSFSSLAAFVPYAPNVAELGQPPQPQFGLRVTAKFLSILGVQPNLGRGFTADQDQPGKDDVVILTDSYWRRRFAADPHILGKILRIGVDRYTVIGVLPPGLDQTLLWYDCGFLVPLTLWPTFENQRTQKWFSVMGRLKPDVHWSAAEAELTTVAARLASDHPAEYGLDGLRVSRLASSFVDAGGRKLYWLVTGLAAFVLVIACSNLASVQLARAFARSHEYAVRSALGASRLDLMAPLLVESVLLAVTGAIFGLLIASWANGLISHYFWSDFKFAIDGRVLLVTSLASLVTVLTFGLAPAWLATRVPTGDALKDSSRGSTSSRSQRRLKCGLVIAQTALALVLVSAAVSFGVGFMNFLRRDLGWNPVGLISGVINIPYATYAEDGKKVALMHALQDKLGQIPGVTRVSVASLVPLSGFPDSKNIVVEGEAPVPAGQEATALVSAVDGGFFTTLGIPLKEGRFLPASYKVGDPTLLVINEAMARRYWPGQSAIGKRVRFSDEPQWNEIIGVVGDISLARNFDGPSSRLQIYEGLQTVGGIWYNFVLQTSLPTSVLTKPVREAINEIDPDILLQDVGAVPQQLERLVSGNNLMMITLDAFALSGLLIALIGLYGVVSQLTQERRREIGIRMALGADDVSVVKLILGQAARLILCGAALGLAGAFVVAMIYRQTMPELRLPGAGVQIGLTVLLGVAGLLACYVPARRASRLNPVTALHSD